MGILSNEEVEKYLGKEGDFSTEIAQVSAIIRSILQNPVIYEEFTEYYDGGYQTLIVEHFPIIKESVEIRDTNSGREVDPPRYSIRGGQSRQITYRSGIWGLGMDRWEVTYQAGLAGTTEEVPADIKMAALLLIKDLVTGGSSGSVEDGEGHKKETIGDYSYEKFSMTETISMSSLVANKVDVLLSRYKKVNI